MQHSHKDKPVNKGPEGGTQGGKPQKPFAEAVVPNLKTILIPAKVAEAARKIDLAKTRLRRSRK